MRHSLPEDAVQPISSKGRALQVVQGAHFSGKFLGLSGRYEGVRGCFRALTEITLRAHEEEGRARPVSVQLGHPATADVDERVDADDGETDDEDVGAVVAEGA